MKRLYLMLMLMASFSVLAAAGQQDSTGRDRGPKPPQGRPELHRNISPEEKATVRADRMQKVVDLSAKQYKKVYKLFLKTEKAKSEETPQMRSPMNGPEGMRPPMGGPEGMRQMPGGGPGGRHQDRMTPPDRENRNELQGKTDDGNGGEMLQLPEIPSEKQLKAMQKEDKKLKKILSEDQYEKWQSRPAERPGKPDKHERPGKPDREECQTSQTSDN